MPSWIQVLVYSGLAAAFYTSVGLPLSIRVAPRQLALFLAPGIGWAVHTAAALPLFMIVGMSRATVIAALGIPVIAAIATLRRPRPVSDQGFGLSKSSAAALIGAALLATIVAAGVMPKFSSDGVALTASIFDHSKVAIVDEIARLGVPPGNPFFSSAETPRLTYYYLWHFSAAELALLAGLSGWSADAMLSWFTAFASLAVMSGIAAWLSGCASAGIWVIVLAATASLRPPLYWVFGVDQVEQFVGFRSGFGGWFFQSNWAPQHIASAMCVVLAIYVLVEIARRPTILSSIIFALLMAAAFKSSTWVGGIALPLTAAPITVVLIVRGETHLRWLVAGHIVGSAVIALLLVSPFLYDQLHASALRGGIPIVLTPVEVLNERAVSAAGPAANWAAYWIVFLVVEFPAIYLTGLISFAWLIRTTTPDRDRKAIVFAFGMMLALSLLCAWLLASTWGENNDLGWRVVLPAVFALMIFAASGLSQLKQRPALLTFSAACILIALGLPDAALLMRENVVAAPTPSSKEFKAAPPLWDAVRRHAQPTERIVNNPRFLELMTPWRANISWALLSNRRSCDAGESYLGPFTVLSDAQQEQVTLQFDRVFDGNAQVDDIKDLVTKYNCSVAVLVPSDGAWNRDPFASSPYYKSVETTADWRIYKAVGASGT